nr:hypothetical protein [Spirochaetia bacterium]
SMIIGNYIVYPLVVMSVKELEMMEKSIVEMGLEQIFSMYHDYNKSGNETLYNFVALSDKINFYNNNYLGKKGYEYFELMGESLFPKIFNSIKHKKRTKT